MDISSAILELAVNADEAGAKNLYMILERGTDCRILTSVDDGTGMSDGDFARALQGGFTTKGEGRGSGLSMIASAAESVEMKTQSGITAIVCKFADTVGTGDIAGAVAAASASPSGMRLVWRERTGDNVYVCDCGGNGGRPDCLSALKKTLRDNKLVW